MTAALRVRDALDRSFPAVVALFLVVAAVGGWAAYTGHVDPGTTTVDRDVSSWERTGSFDHGATVRSANPVYDRGERIDSPVAYFPRVAPVVNGSYRVTYAASDGGRVDVRTDLTLVLQNAEEDTTYWTTDRPLAARTALEVAPGERVRVPFSLNLSRTVGRVERTRDLLGATPGETTVTVRAETRLTGEVNDRPVDRTYVDRLRLRPVRDAVRVDDPGRVTNRSTATRTVRVERSHGPARRLGGPVLAAAGLAGAAALVVGRRRGLVAPTPAEREALARDRFDEWVSRGRLPSAATEGPVVETATLADLVDVAVDADRRVVYDPDREVAAVVDGETTYLYRPDG